MAKSSTLPQDFKICGLASIPSREKSLELTVNSLLPQADQVCVYLNDYEGVPDFLNRPKIVVERSQNHGDIGDAGKFWWSDKVSGYYFSCDDDIVYPANYVQFLLEKINAYDKKAVVGFHGVYLVQQNFQDYYKSRIVFHNQAHNPYNLFVHILGTGALCFYTENFPITPKAFKTKNMADIWFGRFGQKLKFPFICVDHPEKFLKLTDINNKDTIWYQSEVSKGDSSMNTGDIQTKTVLESMPWKLYPLSDKANGSKPLLLSEDALLNALSSNKEIQTTIRYEVASYLIESISKNDHIFQLLKKSGTFYELVLLEAIKKRNLNGIYIDIGANIGNHAIFFANHCPATKVYCVEASPEISKVLYTNCTNNIKETPVVLLNFAITRRSGSVFLSNIDSNNVGMTKISEAPTMTKVQATTIDHCFSEEETKIAVIKIDVEGAEHDAILGGLNIIKTHKPLITAECHTEKDFDKIHNILKKLGYKCDKISYGNSPTYIWEYLDS